MNRVVAVDARMLEHSGIGTYLQNLVQGLVQNGAASTDLLFRFYGSQPLLSKHLPNLSPASFGSFDCPIYSLKEHWDYAFLKKQWDLWHCPHYNVPFVKKGKLVVTVHDLTHIALGDKFFNPLQRMYARTSFAWVRKHADAVIAVSHHTKKDLVEMVGIDPQKIHVIYEGVSPVFKPWEEAGSVDSAARDALQKKYGLNGDFVLYVGNIKPHKNVGQLVRVFRDLRSRRRIKQSLVIVGRQDNRYIDQDKDIQAAQSDPNIRFLSEIPYEELPGLYNLARTLVLPSLYEGFGLVVLEAMACGTPVIVSNRTSLPEIAGNAAEVFDPEEDTNLAHAIEKVLLDRNRSQELTVLGQNRAKQFSWAKMTQETSGVYRKTLA